MAGAESESAAAENVDGPDGFNVLAGYGVEPFLWLLIAWFGRLNSYSQAEVTLDLLQIG